jgi:sodium/bile acid cotransporter 7
LRLDLAASKALTIVASQKTLPVSAFVVAQAFDDRPAAIVPCIVFHILQILLDTVLAHRWSQRSE